MSKMSKSKNNGIDPQTMVEKFGADTVRLFMMFAAPPELTLEWQESGVEGSHRFIKRVWKLVQDLVAQGPTQALDAKGLNKAQKDLRRDVHKTIAKVSDDIGRRQTFNTAIAAIMELMNQLTKAPQETEQDRAVLVEAAEAIVLMLTPIAPHACDVLWKALGHDQVESASWPQAEADAMIEDEKLIVVQVNGKVRSKITVAADASNTTVEQIGLADENVIKFTEGKTVRKVIYVPGKLLNIVVS